MLSLENLEQKVAEFGKTFVAPYTESIDKDARFPKEAYDELKSKVLWDCSCLKNMVEVVGVVFITL